MVSAAEQRPRQDKGDEQRRSFEDQSHGKPARVPFLFAAAASSKSAGNRNQRNKGDRAPAATRRRSRGWPS
jgi:hypothetical protein